MTKVCNWRVMDTNNTIQIYDDHPIRSISKIIRLLIEEFDVRMDEIDVEWFDDHDCGYIYQRG